MLALGKNGIKMHVWIWHSSDIEQRSLLSDGIALTLSNRQKSPKQSQH